MPPPPKKKKRKKTKPPAINRDIQNHIFPPISPTESLYNSCNITLDELSEPHTAQGGAKHCSLWSYQRKQKKPCSCTDRLE